MNLVQEDQAPFPAGNLLHHFGSLFTPAACVCNHGVCGNADTAAPHKGLLVLRCEPAHQPRKSASLICQGCAANMTAKAHDEVTRKIC